MGKIRHQRIEIHRLWPAPTRTVRDSSSNGWCPCCAERFKLKGELGASRADCAKKDGGVGVNGEEEEEEKEACTVAR